MRELLSPVQNSLVLNECSITLLINFGLVYFTSVFKGMKLKGEFEPH